MSCLLTQGFAWPCKTESPGVKSIWLVEYNADDTITVASGEVTAHSLDGGRAYFKYELDIEQAMLESNVLVSRENNSVAYESILTFFMPGMTTAQRNELKLMAKARLRALVLDNEGNYWMMGKDFGASLTEAPGGTGQALTDKKGRTVKIQHKESDDILIVQAAVITSLNLP